MVSNDAFAQLLRPLTAADRSQLEDFDCGDEVMNRFLKRWALTEQARRLSRTYLIRQPLPCPGFLTMSAAQVAREWSGLPRRELRYPVASAMFIGRLGVDVRYQGSGLGRSLVRAARLLAFRLPIGCRFVALEVDEANSRAIGLYRSEGFWVPRGYEPDRGRLLMLYDLATTRPAD